MYNTIKRLCDQSKISVSEVERRAGLSNGVIGGWRTSSPNLDSLEKVASALEMPVTDIISQAKDEADKEVG